MVIGGAIVSDGAARVATRKTILNGPNGRRTAQHPRSIDEVIDIASQVASQDAIRSVHVVTRQRPTYAELVRHRRQADERDLALTVTASGVTFRSPPLPEQGAELARQAELLPRRNRLRDQALREISPALDWLSAHGRSWRTSLKAMSEGTR